jgi:hypothetical protein
MKITTTTDCAGDPPDWKPYTKVHHFEETQTLQDVFGELINDINSNAWKFVHSINVELHFDNVDTVKDLREE